MKIWLESRGNYCDCMLGFDYYKLTNDIRKHGAIQSCYRSMYMQYEMDDFLFFQVSEMKLNRMDLKYINGKHSWEKHFTPIKHTISHFQYARINQYQLIILANQ